MTLISRLEQAEAGSKHLDCLIENALGLAKFDRDPKVGFGDADYNRREPKPYSTSLDAVMTLVPEGKGRWPQLEYMGPNPNNAANGHRWKIWISGSQKYHGESQHSSALALCIASLKAAGYE